ncbi:zinc finger protein 235-like isoform X2 [Anoplophora glabripennis]|uniref:zinc finger protein 235-like isoform X2 n=1 Tax=Anoplophora glabripennis TaxID=217634 RepID=UPI0008745340|nr:zinc finger protein 235-like isoform X2 [Anoplophora glabripennis]
MQPANLNEPFCGLCLSTVRYTNCQKIDDISDILEIVLPDVNLKEIDKHFVCEVCSVKLFAAFNFKSICINTEDIIFPHINASKKSTVDLKEVYLKEKGSIQLNISEDQRICRLCFQLITSGFVSLNEVDVDIIDTYIPQVNISATSHPVICGPCFDSLRTHGSFLRNCLDAQEKYKSIDKRHYIKTKEIEINLEDHCQNVQEKFNSADKPFYIKSEEIEIKVEEDNENSSSSYDLDNEINENKQRYASEDIGAITSEQILKYESGFNENFKTSMSVHNIQIGNSETPEFQMNDKFKYGTNTQQENPSKIQMYKCDLCDYTTKYSWTLQAHQCSAQLHKDSIEEQMLMYYKPLGIQMWKCDICTYETRYKTNLKAHILRHKGGSDSQMYKCGACSFETSRKRYLNIHQLKHKNPSEFQRYKCDVCNYGTNSEKYIKRHQLLHKDSSKVQVYQCETCSFQTKRKRNLKMHQLRHKRLLKTQMYTMYKCDMCTYGTKYKYLLNRHLSMYHNPLGIQMWKCDTCAYETKFKARLKKHQLRHKGLLENQMHKCDTCGYEADCKSHLNLHQLLHKDPSEIKMYKCDACPYEAIQMRYLKDHQLIHKDPSKVQMYKCDTCRFETKRKGHLKRHQLLHKELL